MKYDPAYATSPIFVTDKDYEFSVDPEIITLLAMIATLFTSDEKSCYYYILKIFPFSLKGDAKTWFNSPDPSCVCVVPRI